MQRKYYFYFMIFFFHHFYHFIFYLFFPLQYFFIYQSHSLVILGRNNQARQRQTQESVSNAITFQFEDGNCQRAFCRPRNTLALSAARVGVPLYFFLFYCLIFFIIIYMPDKFSSLLFILVMLNIVIEFNQLRAQY